MKKLLFTLAIIALPIAAFAQDEKKEEKPDGWSKSGNISLLFSQAAFNAEWTGGGTTNYSVNFNGVYDINYKKGKLSWNNRIMADYGITRNRDDEFTRKTNDRLEFNSVLGRQIKETNWYYSWFLNFKTQFAKGYVFGEDENGDVTRTENTHFLSPGYVQTGPGFLWKKSDNAFVNIAPATLRLIFVDDAFTTTEGYVDGDYFGVDQGEITRFEFGAAISAYYKFTPVENVTVENVLNLYANYLEDPQNVDIDYTLNVIMKINEWMSANATLQAIYDDNTVGAFQIRQALAVGLTYKL